MNELDREIEAALRRRAESVQSHPLGFGDVSRRIVRRRRRTASMATAALALPALAGVGWAVTRPEPAGQAVGAPDSAEAPTSTVSASADAPGAWACTGLLPAAPVPQTTTLDGDQWSYFEYCEAIVFSATTVEMPMPTTTTSVMDLSALLDQVVFVDASGGLDVASDLTARLGASPRFVLPGTRTVEQTMAMPTGADVSAAYEVIGRLGIGGFDTWTPDLIDGELPDGIAVVVVIGADWFDHTVSPTTTILCPPPTTESVVSTTTSLLDAAGVPMTTLAAGTGECP